MVMPFTMGPVGALGAGGGFALTGPVGIGMLIGSMALDVFGSMKESKEIERRADFMKEQLYQRSANLGAITSERLHDIKTEEVFAKGTLKAQQATAGIKVGTGSARTQSLSLEGQYRRKMEVIAKKVGFEKAQLFAQAEEIGKRSDFAQEANFWELGKGLLSKGYGIYSEGLEQGWWGTTA